MLTNYYPLNGDGSDASGRNMDATVTGTIQTIDRFGNYGKAIGLLGDGDLITFEHHNLAESDWSYSIWVKFDALPSAVGDAFLLSYANIALKDDVPLFVDDIDNTIKTFCKETNTLISSNTVVEKRKWYNIVLTTSDQTINIYINGQLKATSTGRFTSNTSNAQLAISSVLPGTALKGRIYGAVDDVRFYTKTLNTANIETLYNEEVSHEIISGISSTETSKIRIYTNNQTQNSVDIISDDLIQSIELFDINGASVYKQITNAYSHKINNLTKGVYIVKAISNKHSYLRKVIIK